MKWDEYYEIVVPEEIREREAKKNRVVRFNRWVSSRIGYILHFTPVTGNMISFFRILMVFVAIKNAHHDSLGYVFTNFNPQFFKSGDHVKNLGIEILDYFGL